MAFETFTAGRKITKEPQVSILKQGNFGFNSGCMKLLKEKSITHMQLLFDRETQRIAFKPCTPETQGAYIIRENNGTGQISGTSFLKTYDIAYSEATRAYPATWENGLLIISLN
jgi:hypothetical protein